MKLAKLSEEELDGILYHLSNTLDNIDEHMNNCYNGVLFLGNSVSSDEDATDVSLLNARLCIRYYLKKEDYMKVKMLQDFLNSFDTQNTTIVDHEIIDELKINPN